MSLLDEILERINALPEKERKEVYKQAEQFACGMKWIPNPGPQTDCFFSHADEVFYGGQAGGGKTDLAVGLAITSHQRSLILRRINKDAVKITERIQTILGSRDGYNGQLQRWKFDNKLIELAGCEMEDDKQRFKGDPHDLIVFDEGSDFLESQYRFIIGWNRSSDPNQRCRVLVTSNPPTSADGRWVVKYWGPWLDKNNPHPAKPGELRWFTTVNGIDTEVDGPGPHNINGEPIRARSRTFIPARLSDNPFLAKTDYGSVLAALPEELRRAYRDGDFNVGVKDADFQVIPTAWIVAAQERWTAKPPPGMAMTAMAEDPAGGGRDSAEIARRYGYWYAEMISAQGEETSDGSAAAATIVKHRRDECPVVVDCGGGYGGAVSLRLKDNGIDAVQFNGANTSLAKTKDGSLTFANKRAESWWRMREELDPDQEGGAAIALPPDAELRADLATPTWKLTARGILIESKEEIRKRLGRSPGKGDAVCMALAEGERAAMRSQRRMKSNPVVNLGYGNRKRYR